MMKEYIIKCRETCQTCNGSGIQRPPDDDFCPDCGGDSYIETEVPLQEALEAINSQEKQEAEQQNNETVEEWWSRVRTELHTDGRQDAEKGRFQPPNPGSDDPQYQDENLAYKKGFDERRKELGKNFQWK